MCKIAGCLSSGVNLAVEASATYQSFNKNSQAARDLPDYPYRDSPFNTRDLGDMGTRRDEEAFQELQNYADFQRALSDKISDDIIMDERYPPSGSTAFFNDGFEDYFSIHRATLPSTRHQAPQGQLTYPIIIPQRRPEDESRGWVRAYAPDLMACGISQSVFLNFLDSFNEASKLSPYLDAVNVAAIGAGFIPLLTSTLVSKAVPAAIRLAKGNEVKQKSNTFLALANAELFAPHGLFAMIMTYRPDQVSLTSTVDTSQLFHSHPEARNTPHTPLSIDNPQLPTGATLIFPKVKPSTADQGNSNKLRKIGHFIADYGDRRAQARYALKNPTSHLILNPPRKTNSAKDGRLDSPFSRLGTPDRQKDMHRRRRRKGSSNTSSPTPSSRRNGLLAGLLEDTFANRDTVPLGRVGNPNLIGDVKGVTNGRSRDVREDDGPRRGQRTKKMGMKADVLYLMIVNNPDNDVVSVDGSDTDMNANTGVPSPVRRAQVVDDSEFVEGQGKEKEFRQDRTLDPRLFDSEMNDPGPPPKYNAEVKGRYYGSRQEQKYCEPTL